MVDGRVLWRYGGTEGRCGHDFLMHDHRYPLAFVDWSAGLSRICNHDRNDSACIMLFEV
jgi:hypothetical protein